MDLRKRWKVGMPECSSPESSVSVPRPTGTAGMTSSYMQSIGSVIHCLTSTLGVTQPKVNPLLTVHLTSPLRKIISRILRCTQLRHAFFNVSYLREARKIFCLITVRSHWCILRSFKTSVQGISYHIAFPHIADN